MRIRPLASLPLACILALSACADQIVAPSADPAAAVPARTHGLAPEPDWTIEAGGPTLALINGDMRAGLRDVYAAPDGWVYGAGPFGALVRWNGNIVQPLNRDGYTFWMYGVWVRPNGEVIAVGEGGRAYHEPVAAARRRLFTPATILNDVYGASADSVYAVGSHVVRWNGSTWTLAYTPSQVLQGVWASGPNDVWAVGNGIIVHFDGVSWTESAILGARNTVSGTGPNDVWADSPAGLIHFDGTSWSLAAPGINGEDVWAAGPNNVWAAGGTSDQGEYVWNFDGNEWRAVVPVSSTPYRRFYGVHGRGGKTFLAGADGLLQVFLGGPLPDFGTDLYAVWGFSNRNVFAVGSGGTILHDDGTGWARMASPTTRRLEAIWGSRESDLTAVGAEGTIVHYNGTSWSTQPSSLNSGLRGVWGWRDTVFAVGNAGAVLRRSGATGTWNRMTSALPGDLLDVMGTSASNVIAVGEGIQRWNGTSWSAKGSPTRFELYAVWIDRAGTLYVGGYEGAWVQRAGVWTQLVSSAVIDIWGSGPDDVYFLGWNGLWHYDGATVTPVHVGPVRSTHASPLQGIWMWGSDPSHVFVVGRTSTIVHGRRNPG